MRAIAEAPRPLGLASELDPSTPSRVLGPCSMGVKDRHTRQAGRIDCRHPVEEKGGRSAQTGSWVVRRETARHRSFDRNTDKNSSLRMLDAIATICCTLRRPKCALVVNEPQPRASEALPGLPRLTSNKSCRGPCDARFPYRGFASLLLTMPAILGRCVSQRGLCVWSQQFEEKVEGRWANHGVNCEA